MFVKTVVLLKQLCVFSIAQRWHNGVLHISRHYNCNVSVCLSYLLN